MYIDTLLNQIVQNNSTISEMKVWYTCTVQTKMNKNHTNQKDLNGILVIYLSKDIWDDIQRNIEENDLKRMHTEEISLSYLGLILLDVKVKFIKYFDALYARYYQCNL